MMKRLVLAVACYSTSLFAQAQPPSVEILVKEKSGFLGMGPPRSMTVELSNQNRQLPLTSTNINAGQYYYFLCKPVGGWQFDPSFVEDDLPKLTLQQKEQKFSIAWTGELISDAGGTVILVGFPKNFQLHEPVLVRFQLGDTASEMELKIPEEFWPGYTTIADRSTEAETFLARQQYREAIAIFDSILSNSSLSIFPRFAETKEKRTQAYEQLLASSWSLFSETRADKQLNLKQRIAKADQLQPIFQFLSDSLPNPNFNVSISDQRVRSIVERAREGFVQTSVLRDSLQRAFDDQNVRWIIAGSMAGGTEYLYKTIIEALAYSFASLDFRDTTRTAWRFTIPDELQARLAKYNLTESYETFLRLCTDRYRSHIPVFPPDFLLNLRKDSSAFALPYYSVLKAVNDYYYGNYEDAKGEIFRIFRTSFEPDLSTKFDRMRAQIAIKESNVPADLLKLLREAEAAEQKNDNQTATEKYLQLATIAPSFAYGSYATGKFFARIGDPVRASTFFQRAYNSDTLFFSAYRDAYTWYRKSANFKPMIEVLTQALNRGNDYLDVHFNLGLAYMGDGDVARAIQHFERALQLNASSYQTNVQLGLAYQSVKNYPRAREFFIKAVDIDPIRQDAVELLNKLNELQKSAR